jgi:hypothetical protein
MDLNYLFSSFPTGGNVNHKIFLLIDLEGSIDHFLVISGNRAGSSAH